MTPSQPQTKRKRKAPETPRSTKTPKAPHTRGLVACRGCRKRKTKCDEKKPICSSCHANNRSCVWPDKIRRGPQTGYKKALEDRLLETETALLKLVTALDQSTIEHAFEHHCEPIGHSRLTLPTRFEGSKHEMWDYWEQRPLETALEILTWAKEVQNSIKTRQAAQFDDGNLRLHHINFSKVQDSIKTRQASHDSCIDIQPPNQSPTNSQDSEELPEYSVDIPQDSGVISQYPRDIPKSLEDFGSIRSQNTLEQQHSQSVHLPKALGDFDSIRSQNTPGRSVHLPKAMGDFDSIRSQNTLEQQHLQSVHPTPQCSASQQAIEFVSEFEEQLEQYLF